MPTSIRTWNTSASSRQWSMSTQGLIRCRCKFTFVMPKFVFLEQKTDTISRVKNCSYYNWNLKNSCLNQFSLFVSYFCWSNHLTWIWIRTSTRMQVQIRQDSADYRSTTPRLPKQIRLFLAPNLHYGGASSVVDPDPY